MKQWGDLTAADFERHPVWIGVHNYDDDEPWYEESDEETFRPWTGRLPFAEGRGIVLVAATFELADGSVYPGYCQATPDDWDSPLPPMTMPDGSRSKPSSWSATHGETKLSVMGLLSPEIFIGGRSFDFGLGHPTRRRDAVRSFYAAIRKKPHEVFPVRFAADPKLATGIISGTLDGFFYCPMGGAPSEIDTGESFLGDDGPAAAPVEEREVAGGACQTPIVAAGHEAATAASGAPVPELRRSGDLGPSDFERHPVWVWIQGLDAGEPWYERADKFAVRPWTGPTPVAPEKMSALITATFVMRDGSEYPGSVWAIPENWADIVPPPLDLGNNVILDRKSPKDLYCGSPLAILAEQRPCIFVAGMRMGFWWAYDFEKFRKARLAFYKAIRKAPEAVFPIRFQGAPGLADGIVAGEIDGFCRIGLSRAGSGPRLEIER